MRTPKHASARKLMTRDPATFTFSAVPIQQFKFISFFKNGNIRDDSIGSKWGNWKCGVMSATTVPAILSPDAIRTVLIKHITTVKMEICKTLAMSILFDTSNELTGAASLNNNK